MPFSNLLTATAAAFLLATPVFAEKTYKTQQGHTEVRVAWSHAGVSMQHGEFTKAEGTLVLDEANIEGASLNAVVDATSIHSGVAALDDHIKNADFLEVETYPEITFESASVTRTGDKTADITGNLTMHGVTKPVTLQATLTHIGKHPLAQFLEYYKGDWAAFHARTEIEPKDFGVGMTIPVGTLVIEIDTEMQAVE
ncbi:YceI family protein [Leisingera sp. MMG026]|uniref:YceI family protein n=1 Tax=Leisingera sp. MMG026 TaxID=2909982 RepID=UPI001F2B87B2|nr:YceI family protein [Leisingera sp. MMG026]MCF6433589.1 YceI family protein [Leisingera sp. MMG026]